MNANEPRYFTRYEGETEIMFISAIADLLAAKADELMEARGDSGMTGIVMIHRYSQRLQTDPEFRKAEYERFKAGNAEEVRS